MGPRFDAHSHLAETSPLHPGQVRVVCGTCEADWEAVLAQAITDPQVLPMLGLHPWFVAEATVDWPARLEALLRSHRAGLGECGLDFARQETDRLDQEAAFRTHLRLARALHRPLAIHAVRAWGRLLDLLREEGAPPAGTMVHAYSGSPETARALQAMGVFLSFSGDLLDPERPKLREALLAVEPTRLLLETDGVADLDELVRLAAQLRGVAEWELAGQTWENGQRCFQKLLA